MTSQLDTLLQAPEPGPVANGSGCVAPALLRKSAGRAAYALMRMSGKHNAQHIKQVTQ
jgi:hypothetical protein